MRALDSLHEERTRVRNLATLRGDDPAVQTVRRLSDEFMAGYAEVQRAEANVADLKNQVATLDERALAAWGQQDRKAAEKREEELAQARRDLAMAPRMVEGLARVAQEKAKRFEAYVRENHAALGASQHSYAQAARDRMTTAVTEIVAGHAEWRAEAMVNIKLAEAAGQRSPDVPNLSHGWEQFLRSAERVVGEHGIPPVPASSSLADQEVRVYAGGHDAFTGQRVHADELGYHAKGAHA